MPAVQPPILERQGGLIHLRKHQNARETPRLEGVKRVRVGSQHYLVVNCLLEMPLLLLSQ